MSQYLALCNWERFQHYKDRDPPWIKFYRDILTTESWVLGTDSSRLLQCASILLAARYGNKIPYRYDLIKKVASLDLTEEQFHEAVSYLSSSNYLEIQGIPDEKSIEVRHASTVLAKCSSETEERQRREETEQRRIKPVELPLDVDRVFDHWRQVHEHSQAKLDDKRRALIRKALKTYTVDLLCESISGYLNSPHHMGQNDRNTKYDDIELFLRDSKHVDAGLKFARAPPSANSAVTDHNIRALTDWANGNGSHGQGEIRDVTSTARRGIRQENLSPAGRNLLGSLVKSGL
jgi:hypothetical protein